MDLKENIKQLRKAKKILENDLMIVLSREINNFRAKYNIVPAAIYVDMVPVTEISVDTFGTHVLNGVNVKFEMEE